MTHLPVQVVGGAGYRPTSPRGLAPQRRARRTPFDVDGPADRRGLRPESPARAQASRVGARPPCRRATGLRGGMTGETRHRARGGWSAVALRGGHGHGTRRYAFPYVPSPECHDGTTEAAMMNSSPMTKATMPSRMMSNWSWRRRRGVRVDSQRIIEPSRAGAGSAG